MKGRILFTGSGKLALEDIMEHMPPDYQWKKCAPVQRLFLNMIDEFDPHIIVACVHQCMPGRLQMYDALEETDAHKKVPLIVIGNEEDCNVFRSYIVHQDMKIIVRPVVYENFHKILEEYVTKAIEKKEEEILKKSQEAEQRRRQWKMDEEQREQKYLSPGCHNTVSKKSILVVDDDVQMLSLMKMYLQDLYEVTAVPSGKLGIKFLSKKHADLVLLDYLMPDMDGPEVLKWIREESSCPDIPVLFLTGVADKDKVLRGLIFNPSGYMLKPVVRDELLDRVAELLLSLS